MTASYIAGTPYVGASVVYKAGPGGHRGVVTAWDPVARKGGLGDQGDIPGLERHGGDRRRRGVLRDDGRLVQGGRREDRRAAVAVQVRLRDHRPADRLPRARMGKQYVAVLSGVGGWAGAIVSQRSRHARRHRRQRLRRRDGRT